MGDFQKNNSYILLVSKLQEEQLFTHPLFSSSRFPSFWFSSRSCIISFQLFSVVHFCFFKFNSSHSCIFLCRLISRVLCFVTLFLFYPLIFTVVLMVFLFLNSLALQELRFPFDVVISVSPFVLCPPMIKTQNTEQDPCLIFRKQGKKYLHAGKSQNKQLKSSLLSHISSFEHTK